jgi:hypothetical protein
MQLTELSDEALVSSLAAVCLQSHWLTARMLVHLVEIEERRLDLRLACTSMYDFCVRRMGMSPGAAVRRIAAARMVKRFPALLARVEHGELHLSTLVLLRPHLTEANVDALVAAVVGKTQHEVEELLARLVPKPDVPSAISELPGAGRSRGRIEPLSEARYKVELTASTELRDKLERARDLMAHRNPGGDLAVVVERALDLLLAQLEKERLGKKFTHRPPPREPQGTAKKAGAITRAVRRQVFERDGEQCTFFHEGERCPSRALLELDHVTSRALGGSDEGSNLRVRCRMHNRLHAEQVFGKEHVAEQVDLRQRTSRRVMAPASAPPSALVELARSGLANLGFAKHDVSRVLREIKGRHGENMESIPLPDLLREAIAALT